MYSFDSRVRYSECDERGVLSLPALVNYLQDGSTFHSESLGLGIAHMRELHLAWFINAWQIEIARMPRFCESITVSTWCHTMKRTTARRNYLLTGDDGTPLVRADSLWFVYDTELKRPVRVPSSEAAYDTHEQPLDMPTLKRRIVCEGAFEQGEAFEVNEQHLDSNRHVNNAQYVAMATSALAALTREPPVCDQTRLCVAYRQMALLGDTIVPKVQIGPEATTISLDKPDGDPYCTLRLMPLATDASEACRAS